MKKIAVLGATTLGVASVALASSAMAIVPVKVVVGTATTGNHNITAASTTNQVLSLSSGAGITCTSANVPAASSGVAASYVTAGASVTNVASINRVNFNSCSGSGTTIGVTHNGTWILKANSGATSGSSDVIQGQIDNVSARVFNTGSTPGNICDFDVAGTAVGSYNEASGVLTVNQPLGGALKVTAVRKGCAGGATVGATAKFTGSFQVTSPDGAIRIG